MADTIAERVRRYILDGSEEDLRRLLGVAESTREMARSAFRRVSMQEGWHVIDCGCGPERYEIMSMSPAELETFLAGPHRVLVGRRL